MRITVDRSRCQGHARCASLAPELFDLDEEGYAFVLPGREEVADGDEQALLAVDNCPEEAIRVDPGPRS